MIKCKWRQVRNNEESFCVLAQDVCNDDYTSDTPCENLTPEEAKEAGLKDRWEL